MNSCFKSPSYIELGITCHMDSLKLFVYIEIVFISDCIPWK